MWCKDTIIPGCWAKACAPWMPAGWRGSRRSAAHIRRRHDTGKAIRLASWKALPGMASLYRFPRINGRSRRGSRQCFMRAMSAWAAASSLREALNKSPRRLLAARLVQNFPRRRGHEKALETSSALWASTSVGRRKRRTSSRARSGVDPFQEHIDRQGIQHAGKDALELLDGKIVRGLGTQWGGKDAGYRDQTQRRQ